MLEKSLELEKKKREKNENKAFEEMSKDIIEEYESRNVEISHVSHDNKLVVSKSSSGNSLSAEETFQNLSVDNHTSANSESYIKLSNVYNKTSEDILRNIDENIDNKKFQVKSNHKYQQANTSQLKMNYTWSISMSMGYKTLVTI